jgi:single-stranded-DNA-specific exonuclease
MFPLHDPLDAALRAELAQYDDLTAALLARRGIVTNEDAEKFLNPSYDLHLHDPFLMMDMQKASRRFADAILSGERIAVWSDYDCDGIPGGVLLHDFLAKAGANFENYIPHRHEEGYGMNVSGVEKLVRENGATLIVTADSGTADIEPIARAKELGADVIVTDHHLAGETLPPAFAILNPNARENETYPFTGLCGSAVAWKLVCATLAIAPELREKVPEGWEKWLLDMVGLATIADMVSLIGENRVLATYGLLVMRKSPRIGLQKLCRATRVEQRALTEDDVGFMIAPRVNAASRMGNARDAFQLFITTDENEADLLVKKLEKMNRQRKAEAGAITRAVHTRLKERGSEMRTIIALGDPEWRPALLGLVANTIADEYERPVFLWGREGNLSLKGSFRNGGAPQMMELLRATANTFVEFGGHAKAGGFTVIDTEVFYLEDRLVETYARITADAQQIDPLLVRADAVITPEEVMLSFLKKIERLAPFGQNNPKPLFLLRDLSLREISHFGKGKEHLKLKIDVRDGETIDAVAFFAKGPVARVALALARGSRATILAHLERDTFSRDNPVRLRLLDIRVV